MFFFEAPPQIWIAGIALIAACSAGTTIGPLDTTLLDGNPNWLIVLYMSADNDLEAQAIEDINELEGVDLAGSGITVLVLIDRIAGKLGASFGHAVSSMMQNFSLQ